MYAGHHSRPELSRVDFEAAREAAESDAGRSERMVRPKFFAVQRLTVQVGPGDVLYTPPFWWHHVETMPATESEGVDAISVLVPFDLSASEPIHVCHLR